jgi:NAD(P)H-hydrate repair Nnr-like enzyme with NAD(P)H-hydrate dehydratase domain
MLGTTVHARAGRAAADAVGAISVIAEDVVDALPAAWGTFALK